MRKSEIFWWGVIAVVLGAIFASWGLHKHLTNKMENGYCRVQNNYWEKTEFVDAAIVELLHRRANIDFAINDETTIVRYKDLENFHQQNPLCCMIEHERDVPSLILSGSNIKHTGPNRDKFYPKHYGASKYVHAISGSIPEYRYATFSASSCGDIINLYIDTKPRGGLYSAKPPINRTSSQ